MNKISNILVVLDPSSDEQKALHRSLHLAKNSKASLTVFLCIYDFSYEMTTMLSSDEREAMRSAVITHRKIWIDELLAEANAEDVQIDAKVVWHNRPFEAILEELDTDQYDLVVKGTHPHSVLKSVIFTPTDWHLLRKSKAPVLLVKDHAWPENGNVMVALNAGSHDEHHQILNDKLTHDADLIAKFIKGNLHIVNAYPGTPANIALEIPEFDHDSYSDSVLQYHTNACQKVADDYAVDAKCIHVREGLPEDVIPKLAEELDAELVVIGSIGRTGISAALLGNTAEHVIDQLNCDVLALRPEST